jgi:hypothetical protein
MKLTLLSLEARIAPQEREYLEASDRNGLNRNQVPALLCAGLCRPVSQRTLCVADDQPRCTRVYLPAAAAAFFFSICTVQGGTMPFCRA